MSAKLGNNITKNELVDLYIVKDLKISDISSIYGFKSDSIIRRRLKEFNIPIKGIRHYLIKPEIQFTQEQYEFFDGLMAGDGGLDRRIAKCHNRNAYINCRFKYKEFAEYINNFLNLEHNVRLYVHKSNRYKNGFCENYTLRSQNNTLFTKEQKRWYPYDKKIIPGDFRFSPISMNVLYLCDGNAATKGGRYIFTNAFEKSNIESVLIKQIHDINIDCWVGKNLEIYIPKHDSVKFLEYIGSCPIKCYEYKWDN